MPKFRKKPVVIEARQLKKFATVAEYEDLASWCRGEVRITPEGNFVLDISTLEGSMHAEEGDWIIQGLAGEYYPCKPDIFEATYEIVSDA